MVGLVAAICENDQINSYFAHGCMERTNFMVNYVFRMPYTEATMLEVLRKGSIVPLGLFHKSINEFEYKGFTIPNDIIFLSNTYAVHHDPEYWEKPYEFRPQRFITATGEFRKDERVIPFSVGKKSCPGEKLAMIQFFLFLTGLLQKFEFTLNPNEPVPCLDMKAGFVIPPPPHKLILKDRRN